MVGADAVYVRVEPTARGVQTAALRVPKPTGWHLGPITSRATAAAATSGVRRLAAMGVDVLAVLHAATDGDPRTLDDAFDALTIAAGDDAVELALLRRDRAALHDLANMHRWVEAARSHTGTFHLDGHRVSVVQGLLHGEHLPPSSSSMPMAGTPLPCDLLAEVLMVADAVASAGEVNELALSPPLGSAPAPG